MMALPLAGASPARRLLRFALCGLAAAALAWTAGFVWFLHTADQPAQLPVHADGIVAFTGGPERVETALRLLAQGRADRLLLSGIGGGAELAELARFADVDPAPLASHVTLGRNAASTRGNAVETADWVRGNAIRSLIVVTSAYHMPRALTELARTIPNVSLYAVPVDAPGRAGRAATSLRLVLEEYTKFLATSAGLTAILPTRDSFLHNWQTL